MVGSEAELSEIQLEMISDAIDQAEEVGDASERVKVVQTSESVSVPDLATYKYQDISFEL